MGWHCNNYFQNNPRIAIIWVGQGHMQTDCPFMAKKTVSCVDNKYITIAARSV